MRSVTKALNGALAKIGLKITRIPPARGAGPHSVLFRNKTVADLEQLVRTAEHIPGMLSEDSAKFLFALCYMQQIDGDVVEIGSWQGYSTSFLARAVAELGKGRLYAIDHFKGNVGKEAFYVAQAPDLSDLQNNFRENMREAGLGETVTLLAMPNSDAAERLRKEGVSIRFLFIDGDHSKEGVQNDVNLFFPLLKRGSIVVFDDCSPHAQGVIDVIDELFRQKICERAFAFSNTLVAML